MTTFANVMVQNEALILPHVFKYWKDYKIDKWIFYDDRSTDNTIEVIKSLFGDNAVVLTSNRTSFSECDNRGDMLEYSRQHGADLVFAIDADELMTIELFENWHKATDIVQHQGVDLQMFWYNVVESIDRYRTDPMYEDNFRTFLVPMARAEMFDGNLFKYHTPRTPKINCGKMSTDSGMIHLQAINVRYYALKQLWYKHYEFHTWGHSIDYINRRYDPVVNNLKFRSKKMPKKLVGDIEFDPSIYDEIEKVKGYKNYINTNLVSELVTFGKEYL